MKLLIIAITLLLTGCYDSTVSQCKERGYSGILISESDFPGNTDNICSDGEIVNDYYKSEEGPQSINLFVYLEF